MSLSIASVRGALRTELSNGGTKYLKDIDFRYTEEKIAHIAEYVKACELAGHRSARRRALRHISKKLSHPLYGNMVTFENARRERKQGLRTHEQR